MQLSKLAARLIESRWMLEVIERGLSGLEKESTISESRKEQIADKVFEHLFHARNWIEQYDPEYKFKFAPPQGSADK